MEGTTSHNQSVARIVLQASVAAPPGIRPVVVGGVAVYCWTASDEFLTYDIDVEHAVRAG